MISRYEWLLFGIIFLLMAVLGYAGYSYNILDKNFTKSELKAQNLLAELTDVQIKKNELSGELLAEQERNDFLEDQIREITGKVDTLTKLSQTDKELLQKYSKVYFLNENYAPSKLVDINTSFLKDKSQPLQIHAEVRSYLRRMLRDADDNGTPLLIVSAYRSFSEQQKLKLDFKVVYGSGANAFSADQGYSEHQLGTTVDFATASSTTATFEKTSANQWLVKNAHKYGFVLSYPKSNKYYVYEPWHWRFVGVDLATKLHDDEQYFYDLSQREIDQYLVSIFD